MYPCRREGQCHLPARGASSLSPAAILILPNTSPALTPYNQNSDTSPFPPHSSRPYASCLTLKRIPYPHPSPVLRLLGDVHRKVAQGDLHVQDPRHGVRHQEVARPRPGPLESKKSAKKPVKIRLRRRPTRSHTRAAKRGQTSQIRTRGRGYDDDPKRTLSGSRRQATPL